MGTSFDRWEKDPFFYAAEEVQESADRLESAYRQWIIHEKKTIGGVADSPAERRRELNTALGTAKWQLEELERAVRSTDHALSAGEATVTRHSDFIEAMWSKVLMVEKALKELNQEEDGCSDVVWVRLDEGERDDLAHFLSLPKSETEKVLPKQSGGLHEAGNRMDGETSVCFSNPCLSNDSNPLEIKFENTKGHRRVASASADLGVWKISVSTEHSPRKLSDQEPNPPLARILNYSELRTVETATKPKWYRHGFRKWKGPSHEDMEESISLRNQQLRGMDACYAYEKSKSCLSDCTDESYSKQLYVCLGAFQRQIQRSQYQIQYGRPFQIVVWILVTIILVGAGFCFKQQLSRPVGFETNFLVSSSI